MEGTSWDSSTQLLLMDNQTINTMKSQEVVSYRSSGSEGAGWYKGPMYKGDKIVNPGEYLMVRNQNASEDYTFFAHGDLPRSKVGQILPAGSTDVYVGAFAVPVAVSELDLEGEYQILLIDNETANYMKSQEVISYRTTGSQGAGWYKGPAYYGDTIIEAGTGFVLRRGAASIEAEWAINPY
jgi:uncharacterized protein (TIGR02597 family)